MNSGNFDGALVRLVGEILIRYHEMEEIFCCSPS